MTGYILRDAVAQFKIYERVSRNLIFGEVVSCRLLLSVIELQLAIISRRFIVLATYNYKLMLFYVNLPLYR